MDDEAGTDDGCELAETDCDALALPRPGSIVPDCEEAPADPEIFDDSLMTIDDPTSEDGFPLVEVSIELLLKPAVDEPAVDEAK